MLRELARPLKAIKVKNIPWGIFDISGPYIAWVELGMDKYKYKWAEAYFEGMNEYILSHRRDISNIFRRRLISA